MLWDEFQTLPVFNDDFVYVAQARSWPVALAHLFEPHNAHVVPVFRIWTFALVTISGRLVNLPVVFATAGYLGLIAAMLVLGLVVARETRQPAVGLAAMSVLGISTVIHPAATWFSASQALWAGTAILVTLAFLRSWCESGGTRRLIPVAVTALLAPTIWTGGLLAGPAAIAYLASKKSLRNRVPVLVAGVILCSIALILVANRGQLGGAQLVWEKRSDVYPRPVQAVLHTAQALVEVCICGNLGLDVKTTPRQAVALLFALGAFYVWTRRSHPQWNALESTGAVIALGSYLLIFFFRGNQPYSSLRVLSWYNAIPQMGSILFFAGWWSALNPQGTKSQRMSLGQAPVVVVFVLVFCLMQLPRAAHHLIELAPQFAAGELQLFPSNELLAGRARYFKIEFHDRQRRALGRLDRLDALLSDLKASPETLRDVFGGVRFPGLDENQPGCDVFNLLTPRPRNDEARPELAARTTLLIDLLRPEPEPNPPWLEPKHPTTKEKTSRTIDAPAFAPSASSIPQHRLEDKRP